MTQFDLNQTDLLLMTTRSVRKRLDLERPVPREVLLECIRVAVQAPTGSNAQGWRWLIVDEPAKRRALAELYREAGAAYLRAAEQAGSGHDQTGRVASSARWLAEHLHEVPVMVIPCLKGRIETAHPAQAASFYGSIFPAVWSFQLALRARGLGSTLTTFHLANASRAAELLGIPPDVTQTCLLPVAYTKGTDFKAAERGPVEYITYWNHWKATEPPAGKG